MGVLNNLKLLKLSLKIFNTFLNFNKETAYCFLVQYVVASGNIYSLNSLSKDEMSNYIKLHFTKKLSREKEKRVF